MSNFFVVILGEEDTLNRAKQIERLNTFGEVYKLVTNTYGLVSGEGQTFDKIRDVVSGEEKYITIVIQIVAKTKCGWCLEKDKSDFMTETYKKLRVESYEQ
jgi:hypothetical protein